MLSVSGLLQGIWHTCAAHSCLPSPVECCPQCLWETHLCHDHRGPGWFCERSVSAHVHGKYYRNPTLYTKKAFFYWLAENMTPFKQKHFLQGNLTSNCLALQHRAWVCSGSSPSHFQSILSGSATTSGYSHDLQGVKYIYESDTQMLRKLVLSLCIGLQTKVLNRPKIHYCYASAKSAYEWQLE